VLEIEHRVGAHPERRLLAADRPVDGTVRARDVVDLARVPGRDEDVAVGLRLDRVDVEVVPRHPLAPGDRRVTRPEGDVVEAVPLVEDETGLDVDLLGDRVEHDLLGI
jgi:hypothetical protein